MSETETLFQKNIKQFPAYICTCCHRTWYRHSVSIYSHENYNKLTDQQIEQYISGKSSFDGCEYICQGCHKSLKTGVLPATAVANGLKIDPIPDELYDIGELESVLIVQRIICFKLVNLPRGGHKGLIGSFVNVPIHTEKTCLSLPRTVADSGSIPLKLKRRVRYKGYYLHQKLDHRWFCEPFLGLSKLIISTRM